MSERTDLTALLQMAMLVAGRSDGWLARQRWYADKGHVITSAEVVALRVEEAPEGDLALAIVQLRFAGGGSSRYFIPLQLTEPQEGSAPLVGEFGGVAVRDAVATPWFGEWLLAAMQQGQDAEGWPAALGPESAAYLARAAEHPAQVLRGEQSNTSIRYGDAVIVKLFRRLQPGVNPDEEALRALSEEGFAHAPAFVGSLAWQEPGSDLYPLALATAFVPHQSDGWTWLLERLAGLPAGVAPDVSAERLLGRRTAEMHLALAAALAGEQGLTATDATAIAVNTSRSRAALQTAAALIEEGAGTLPAPLQMALPAILAALHAAQGDIAGYAAELGQPRLRTHGDYHLGQTLRTADDWVILDFEGEPARPVAERREPASALKDVAGMLRSFAYARGAAALALPEAERPAAEARLRAWEVAARAAFLDAYRAALSAAGADLVPADDDAFARALRAWELDKALYEIMYEARNRPDWLGIPLAALMR